MGEVVRNFKNVADMKAKERAYLNLLRQQADLDSKYKEAQDEYADEVKLGITPVSTMHKTVEEERQDTVKQRQIAFDNLKSIMQGEYATRVLSRLNADQIWDINSRWADIVNSLKGRTNMNDVYFIQFWNRYERGLRRTGDTGYVLPIQPEDLDDVFIRFTTLTAQQTHQLTARIRAYTRAFRGVDEATIQRVVADALQNLPATASILQIQQRLDDAVRATNNNTIDVGLILHDGMRRTLQDAMQRQKADLVAVARTLERRLDVSVQIQNREMAAIARVAQVDQSTAAATDEQSDT